ncbi:hypothetical protein DMUE_1099 [Dictyocoela muelleri]|nr:hypothetical protein DMUE_1099 [Dictyocoela muelleri]
MSQFSIIYKSITADVSLRRNCRVFGIADTFCTPSKYYVEVVPNRKRGTLLPIIRRICRPETIMWSDEWRAYSTISTIYEHGTVNHSPRFVNPIEGVHTQNIESLWNELKRKLKGIMGIGIGQLQGYLNEWIWKDANSPQKFKIIKFIDISFY